MAAPGRPTRLPADFGFPSAAAAAAAAAAALDQVSLVEQKHALRRWLHPEPSHLPSSAPAPAHPATSHLRLSTPPLGPLHPLRLPSPSSSPRFHRIPARDRSSSNGHLDLVTRGKEGRPSRDVSARLTVAGCGDSARLPDSLLPPRAARLTVELARARDGDDDARRVAQSSKSQSHHVQRDDRARRCRGRRSSAHRDWDVPSPRCEYRATCDG